MTKLDREISETAAKLRSDGLDAVEDLTAEAQKTMEAAAHKAKELAHAAGDEAHRQADHAKTAVVDTVEKASTALRGTSVSGLANQAKGFAKDHPALFVAGFALAGFALTRMLRASEPQVEAAAMPTKRVKGKSAKKAAKRAAALRAKAAG